MIEKILDEVLKGKAEFNPVVEEDGTVLPNLSPMEWILELMEDIMGALAVVNPETDLKKFREKIVNFAVISLSCIEAHDREYNEENKGE